MKLAVIVNLFDGEELLEGALSQIRNSVNEIIVVWQSVSNLGEQYGETERVVRALVAEKWVDIEFEYFPDFGKSPRENEMIKRRIGIDIARSHNTHFLFLDADEYYETSQFEDAVVTIEKGNYDSSFCRLHGYYREPIYRLQPMEGIHVPFIHKLSEHTSLGSKKFHRKHKIPVDPTRATFPIGKSILFEPSVLVMHHYTLVRKDMGRKLRNTSMIHELDFSVKELLDTWEAFDPQKPYDNLILKVGHHVEEVPNQFGISL